MILCAGENLIDMIQTAEAGGSAPEFRALIGGSPYNTARALGRLRAPVGYITPLSTDRMGALLAAALEGDGVALLGGRSDRPSSLALVALENGQPRYQFYRDGVADRDISLDALRAALPADAAALHLGSLALIGGPDADALEDLPVSDGAHSPHARAIHQIGHKRGDEHGLACPAQAGDAKTQCRLEQQARDRGADARADAFQSVQHCICDFTNDHRPPLSCTQDKCGRRQLPEQTG